MPFSGTALLFDLDGTLVDTAPDLAGAMNDVLALEGLAPLPLASVRPLIGHGARALIERGFAHHGRAKSEAEIEALRARFIDIYRARIARDSRPFPGVVEGLASLRGAGARLAVVTNKPADLTHRLLAALDLARHFDTIVGFETAPRPKPHADPIDHALAALGLDHDRAAMVGDSETDVGAARAAGIPIVLVAYGYTLTPAGELGGDRLIETFDALPAALRAIFGCPTG